MAPTDFYTAAQAVGDDWVDGQYYDDAERDMDVQWRDLVWPMIQGADFSTTLDLAAGHGRNTARLLEQGGRVIAVDINQTNIDFMRRRFGDRPDVTLIRNLGTDLREVPGASVTFLYSFDAMVHFDSDVVRAYIREFRRVMRPGARGFCHYSNNYANPTGTYRDHPGWRNFMSRALFEHWLTREGFRVLESRYVKGVREVVPQDDGDCDAMTLFELPPDAEPRGGFLDLAGLGDDASAGGAQVAPLRDELARLNGAVRGSEEKIRKLEELRDYLGGENAGLKEHARGLEGENRLLREEIQGLKEHRDHLEKQSAGLSEHARGLEEEGRQLRQGVQGLEEYRDHLLGQVESLRAHIQGLEALLDEARRESQGLREQSGERGRGADGQP